MSIALAVAAEWDAQTDTRLGIQPVNMPMMSIASTAIDQVEVDPSEAIQTCLKYLPTDSALFLTTETDRILLSKQKQHLTPVLKWIRKHLGVELQTTSSVAGRLEHPAEIIAKFESILKKMVRFTIKW